MSEPGSRPHGAPGVLPPVDALTEDELLGGQVRLRQPADGYRAAIDPVMLAAAVAAAPRERVLEVGAGHGAASICLARRIPGVHVTGLELQPAMVRLANDNARLNGLSQAVEVMVGDLVRPLPRVAAGGFDHVMANPPFLDARRATASPVAGRDTANVEGEASLAHWLVFMLRMVRSKGSLTLVHRADRLDEILSLLRPDAGEIVVFPLWPRRDRAAKRVIVRARKAVRSPTTLAAGLVLHEPDGTYTPEADAVLRGGALDILARAS